MDEFAITVAESKGYLLVTVCGHATRTNLFTVLQRIKAETELRDLWRVLLDMTGVPVVPGTFDKFDLAVELRCLDPGRAELRRGESQGDCHQASEGDQQHGLTPQQPCRDDKAAQHGYAEPFRRLVTKRKIERDA